MWPVLEVLIGGIGVNCGHQTVHDSEFIMEHFGKRGQAVSGARSI